MKSHILYGIEFICYTGPDDAVGLAEIFLVIIS